MANGSNQRGTFDSPTNVAIAVAKDLLLYMGQLTNEDYDFFDDYLSITSNSIEDSNNNIGLKDNQANGGPPTSSQRGHCYISMQVFNVGSKQEIRRGHRRLRISSRQPQQAGDIRSTQAPETAPPSRRRMMCFTCRMMK
ncbi:hypothetical protein O181_087924 [Austropuccinia psidii MF-1]|uniref:Uncharacterized protein n=1 Tax=Austropuccinia psidii MF-1 TaxID=1389203 RepID=A0A9Q3P2J6_9BASI|nr:hypothetical protein [Austropuccinia psidii MF-1]